MNAYERRRQERLQAVGARREKEREEIFISTDQIIRAYEAAFKTLYGTSVNVSSKKGWIYVNGKRVQRGRLIEMTKILEARQHEKELNTPGQSL